MLNDCPFVRLLTEHRRIVIDIGNNHSNRLLADTRHSATRSTTTARRSHTTAAILAPNGHHKLFSSLAIQD